MKIDESGNSTKVETIPITVVQNNYRGGYRTLQLHRQSESGASSQSITPTYNVPLVTTSELGSHKEIAKKYLVECKEITTPSSQQPSKKGFMSRLVSGKKIKPITCEAVGDLHKLRNVPPIYEQSFSYKYCNYPIHGAFSRVQLDTDYKLMGLTLVSPLDKNFQGLECDPQLKSGEALEIVRNIAGYDEIPEQWSANPSLKWYFNSSSGEWRLSYIVEGVLQRKDKSTGKKILGQFLFRVMKYVIDANSGDLIEAVPMSR
jgi:hypothetical protein